MALTQAHIQNLQPGDVLWSVETYRMGNTTMRAQAIYSVKVKEILYYPDTSPEYLRGRVMGVLASWNGNAAKKLYVDALWRLHAYHPKPKRTPFQEDASYQREVADAAEQNAEDKAKWKPRLDAQRAKDRGQE